MILKLKHCQVMGIILLVPCTRGTCVKQHQDPYEVRQKSKKTATDFDTNDSVHCEFRGTEFGRRDGDRCPQSYWRRADVGV